MKAGARGRPSWLFFVPMTSLQPMIQTVAFWDGQAPWQQTWLAHCRYHQDIIPLVLKQTRPGWQVLDIGAGSGVLTLPLQQQGCRVTALEPSRGMRGLLRQTLSAHPAAGVSIDSRTWEEIPLAHLQGYDLMIACNSLHVTACGFSQAFDKIVRAAPRHICIVSETRFAPTAIRRPAHCYRLLWQRQLTADSSLAYHSYTEVWEHFQHRWGRPPTAAEKTDLKKALTYADQHYWLRQEAHITVWWWSNLLRREYHDRQGLFSCPVHGLAAGELSRIAASD